MNQLKILFAFTLVGALSACSNTPERDTSVKEDQEVIVDHAPGVNKDTRNAVEIVPLSEGNRIRSTNVGPLDSLDEMKMIDVEVLHEPVLYFGLDQYELNDENTAVVSHFAKVMLDNPKQRVSVQGHTDERGSPEYNLALGEKRAKSVAQAMMLFGVPESRIETTSFGEIEPADPRSSELAWQKNRRVELVIQ